MVRLRHIDPQGHVDSPLLGRQGHPDDKTTLDDDGRTVALEGVDRHGHGCLEPGEVLDLPEKLAKALLEQVGNWELADAPRKAAKRAPRKRAAKKAAAPAADQAGQAEQDGEPK